MFYNSLVVLLFQEWYHNDWCTTTRMIAESNKWAEVLARSVQRHEVWRFLITKSFNMITQQDIPVLSNQQLRLFLTEMINFRLAITDEVITVTKHFSHCDITSGTFVTATTATSVAVITTLTDTSVTLTDTSVTMTDTCFICVGFCDDQDYAGQEAHTTSPTKVATVIKGSCSDFSLQLHA
jgi:hypothetical protein